MAGIDGIRGKTERAKQHILDLDKAIRAFCDSEPYTLASKDKSKISHTALYVADVKPIPELLSLILGDAVHNLRSALDHLVWQLVEAGGGIPSRKNMFPICKTAKQYASALQSGKIEGVCTEAEKLIGEIQPYATGDQTLCWVNDLDIVDKHRLVLTVAMYVPAWRVGDLQRGPSMWFPTGSLPLEAGCEIFNIPTSTYEGEKHENFKLGIDVAFGQSEIAAGEPVLETLNKMADFVAGLARMFERFLI